MTKVLLYSGGMDSWLCKRLWKPDICVHVRLWTPNEVQEMDRIRRLEPDTVIHSLDISKFEDRKRNFLLPCRNLMLATIASYYGDVICLGANSQSIHFDNSDRFCEDAGRILTSLWRESDAERTISIVTPFSRMSKTDILREFVKSGGDAEKCWNESFSCYEPLEDGSPCRKCTSCMEKKEAFVNNGFHFHEKPRG